jgi:GntP family gluconate:H+ symporter
MIQSPRSALAALSIAIFLILKKVPAYGMIVGALAGGLIGGADLTRPSP